MAINDGQSDRTTHYVDARGNEVPLVEDPSLLAVKFKPGRSTLAPQAQAFIRDAASFATQIPRYGVKLYRANAKDPRVAALRNDPSVAFAGSVFRRAPESREVVVVLRRFHVGFRPGVTREEIDQLNDQHGVQIVRQLDVAPNTFVLEGSGTENGIELARRYRDSELVAWTEPELIQRHATKSAVATPPGGGVAQAGRRAARDARATTYLAKQWHLDKANVKNAWKTTRGSTAICVAILDDGVDVQHVEFKGKVVKQFDFSTDTADGSPKSSEDKHGTACAGVATAFGVKVSGAAPNCRLIAVRTGDFATGSDESDMFLWAADNGADVISCSWGPPDDGTTFPMPELTRLAITEITRVGGRGRKGKGIPIFFAAGNGNEDVMADGYASNENVMAIAASTSQDRKAEYSDFGPAICVCAPSNGFEADELGVVTTDRRGSAGYNPDPEATPQFPDFPDVNYCDNFGGTSSASPLAAGIAALMLSVNSKLTPAQVRACLQQSARRIGKASDYDAAGHSDIYGHGCVDAAAAIKLAKTPPAVSTPAPATPKPPLITPVAKSVSRSDPPPSFDVNPSPNPQYAIEIATDPKLFDATANGAQRSFGVNFFATWDGRAPLPRFSTGSRYQLPASVWNAMKGANQLYYRALTCNNDAWGNYIPTIYNSEWAKAPSIQITAARGAARADRTTARPSRGADPAILGPDVADPGGPPPTFTVTPGSDAFFGVEVATDEALFASDGVDQRGVDSFYGSWERALLPSPEVDRGEGTTTYTLPAPVWERLRDADRLFYRAVSAPSKETSYADFRSSFVEGRPETVQSIDLQSQHERTVRAAARTSVPITGRTDDEANWKRPAQAAAADRSAGGTRTAAATSRATGTPAVGGYELGPVPARPFRAPVFTGEYPGSLRFIQAKFYQPYKGPAPTRRITGIVIHITDGPQRTALAIASYFKDPRGADGAPVQASAHYVVGQAGEIVQCVRENDVAFHAHAANAWSIGIEHCANTSGLALTEIQYASSAALVRWLCDRYQISPDRTTIRGHAEADPRTTHKQCPDGAKWDWEYYMDMVVNAMSRPRTEVAAG
jgi:hypothetical protein